MAMFYRKILRVPESKLRCELFIYDDINEEAAIDYWSKKVKIPKERFIKTQVLKSRSRHTKSKLKWGSCNIYFSSTEMRIKIDEWLSLLKEDLRV